MRELADGWRTAQAELRAAPQVAPAAGFTKRWRQRLARHQAAQRRRQLAVLMGGTLSGAFAALAVLGALALNAPAGLAASVMRATIDTVALLDSGLRVTGALVQAAPAAAAAVLVSVTLAWLSAIWFASLYRFAFQNLTNGEKR